MREITMPEVKLPDIKLPEGLRDMTRDDIVQAAHDARVRGAELQKKIELPKQIADRLPRRRRPNPLLPIAGIMAVGAMIAGVWWLFTSSVTGPRVRSAVNELKQRVTGETSDVVRYDNEQNLGSLLSESEAGRPSTDGMPASPGTMSEGVGQSVY